MDPKLQFFPFAIFFKLWKFQEEQKYGWGQKITEGQDPGGLGRGGAPIHTILWSPPLGRAQSALWSAEDGSQDAFGASSTVPEEFCVPRRCAKSEDATLRSMNAQDAFARLQDGEDGSQVAPKSIPNRSE